MDITPKITEARRLLDGAAPKPAARQAIGALAAMGLLASATVLMAGAVVLGPGVRFEDPAPAASVVP